MSKETITPPELETTDTRTVLRTLAEAFGEPLNDAKRYNLTYDYDAWQDALHTIYPIQDYDTVLNVVDEYTNPPGLGSDETNNVDPAEHFEGIFLRHALADMIATAYLNNDLESVPTGVFNELYETHDFAGEDAAGSIAIGALGAFHPDIDYRNDVLHGGVLDDFAALFCHLQLIWSIDPDQGCSYYEDILTNGHDLLDNATGTPGDAKNEDWYAGLAVSFAGAIIEIPGRPLGFSTHAFTRGDEILDTTGYPHDDAVYQELADVTVTYVTLSNMHHSAREAVEEQSSLTPNQ